MTDPHKMQVEVVLACNRAYMRWPYDPQFLAVFKDKIDYHDRRYYPSKWWHVERSAWPKTFSLLKGRYTEANVHIRGSWEDRNPPAKDEDFDDGYAEKDISGGPKTDRAKALATLHLLSTADDEDAKKMYQYLSHKNHPDKGVSDDTVQKQLNLAYEVIQKGK